MTEMRPRADPPKRRSRELKRLRQVPPPTEAARKQGATRKRVATTARLDQTVGFIRAIDVIADQLGPEGRPDAPDVSTRELQALRIIGWSQQLRMSDLATAMRVPLSTASRVVDRLTRKGLLERDGDKDRRIVHVRFSPHGLKVGRFLMEWRIATAQAMLEQLPRHDRQALLVALEELTARRD